MNTYDVKRSSGLIGLPNPKAKRGVPLQVALDRVQRIDNAAPYLSHFVQSAPYLAAAAPELLGSLLNPSTSSLKPPAAQVQPTRINLFKTTASLGSTAGSCNACPVSDGTIMVIHYGTVPPITYMCSVAKVQGHEVLVPYRAFQPEVSPATQFTYAANAAHSAVLEITSFAASMPLNGQVTAAHVMDLDDLDSYLDGTFELRSTTPKDAMTSLALQKGLVMIMGPEAFPTTLIHPFHGVSPAYNGYSVQAEANLTLPTTYRWDITSMTPHRWWVNTTIKVDCLFNMTTNKEGNNWATLRAHVLEGECPSADLAKCASLHSNKQSEYQIGVICVPKNSGENKGYDASQDKPRKATKTLKEHRKDNDTCPYDNMYNIVGELPLELTENLAGFTLEVCADGGQTEITYAELTFRSTVNDPEHQFGPAHVLRFQGITKDIVIQYVARAAVAGIQSGQSRAIAPPTTPSMYGAGSEDAVLVQALFDDPATPIARTMSAYGYSKALEAYPTLSRDAATQRLEAAPIGDTIRGIANTIGNIGRSIGGPFSTLGDIIGTVGNIAGGIGDTVSNIFSTPQRLLMAAPFYDAAPAVVMEPFVAADAALDIGPAHRSSNEYKSAEQVIKDTKSQGWSPLLNNALMGNRPIDFDTCQLFPYVNEAGTQAGLAYVFVSTSPLIMADRHVHYRRCKLTRGDLTFRVLIDERLVDFNNKDFVKEYMIAVAMTQREEPYLSTDAPQPIFGDSCTAAILAACFQPSQRVAVTGAIAPSMINNPGITPVGMLPVKLQACIDEGIGLICPDEPAARTIRRETEGTAVCHVGDIMTGRLSQSPTLIIVEDFIQLLMALSFFRATSSKPIGTEEKIEKEKTTAPAREKQVQILAERQTLALEGKSESERRAIVSSTFKVDVPGFGQQEKPLMDLTWWGANSDELSQPPPGGMGIPLSKIDHLIEIGAIDRLKGIAMGLISRLESRLRKGGRGAKKQPQGKAKGGRLPQYKKRQPTQLSEMLNRLRQEKDKETQARPEVQPPQQPTQPAQPMDEEYFSS